MMRILLQLIALQYYSLHSFCPTAISHPSTLPALSSLLSFPVKQSTPLTYNHYYHFLPLQSWCDLFGYEAVKVIGQTCKMLQGEETEMDRIEEVMNGVKVRRTPHTYHPMRMHVHNSLFNTCYHTSITTHLVDRLVLPAHYCFILAFTPLLLFNYRSTDGLEAPYLRTTTRMERK
jgi:hypothetical protein